MKIKLKLLCAITVCLFPTIAMANLRWVRITAIRDSLPNYVKLESSAPHLLVASGQLVGDRAPCELRFENTYDVASKAFSNARLCVLAEAKEVCVTGQYVNDRAFVYSDTTQVKVVSESKLDTLVFEQQYGGYLVSAVNAGVSMQCELR